MGLAVVTVAAGGMPVVDVTGIAPRTGLPVTEATNGYGVPVTKVAALGMPVVFESIGVGESATDPFWSSVVLLMGFNGADGSTGAPGLTDESIAVNGTGTFHNQAQIDTAQFKFGTSSLLLDGTTDWVSFPSDNDFVLSTLPFTIECWIRPTTIVGTHFICVCWETSGLLAWSFYQLNEQIWLNVSTIGTDNISFLGGGTLTANAWHAVCVDFDGITYRIYINGAMVASSTVLKNISASIKVLGIGGSSNSGAFSFAGWIDELRLTKAARYASNTGYTVRTTAFPRSA